MRMLYWIENAATIVNGPCLFLRLFLIVYALPCILSTFIISNTRQRIGNSLLLSSIALIRTRSHQNPTDSHRLQEKSPLRLIFPNNFSLPPLYVFAATYVTMLQFKSLALFRRIPLPFPLPINVPLHAPPSVDPFPRDRPNHKAERQQPQRRSKGGLNGPN